MRTNQSTGRNSVVELMLRTLHNEYRGRKKIFPENKEQRQRAFRTL
jgi:hypothetical protein